MTRDEILEADALAQMRAEDAMPRRCSECWAPLADHERDRCTPCRLLKSRERKEGS